MLISLSDLKGDLRCHTIDSDGENSIEEMCLIAIEKGYEYIAITDYFKFFNFIPGQNEAQFRKQLEKIDFLNANFKNFKILKSCQAEILSNGVLNLPTSILKELDFTVCCIHSKYRLSQKEHMDRIKRAMDNPYFHILGNPAGRLVNHSSDYEENMEEIIDLAKKQKCILELNSDPARLDIKDTYCKMAKEKGVKIVISSDAYNVYALDNIIMGINEARRGGLEPSDVINTQSLIDLKKNFNR